MELQIQNYFVIANENREEKVERKKESDEKRRMCFVFTWRYVFSAIFHEPSKTQIMFSAISVKMNDTPYS
ncbi:hypothetical protein VIGAN_09043900 [Vigna angularis var. angularis]|uniref:Uncharacterized protein n=1 Tax=Vigna angularis var. angularis TaxID=157739 RepID=A0A0S3SWM3_PHAAN|nr:hypothetical protein VIGAN_09043900 [Vigna angularis var. angularis]